MHAPTTISSSRFHLENLFPKFNLKVLPIIVGCHFFNYDEMFPEFFHLIRDLTCHLPLSHTSSNICARPLTSTNILKFK